MAVRNALYDRHWKAIHSAKAPVISVGNLTLGGTGKTPCVEYIAEFFRRLHRRVAVLSRGYGSTDGPNDEARVLSANLPDVLHLQGKDRVALAARAVKDFRSEVLILDDGFQHRRLARNLDIVVIDSTSPWGYGFIFPRGLLRESRTSLRRAGMIVLSRVDLIGQAARGRLQEEVSRIAPQAPVATASHRPRELVNSRGDSAPIGRMDDRPLAAFCGIGNPEAFRQTLISRGWAISDFRAYPDHHAYTAQDIENLRAWVKQLPADGVVVTTQKDLVKLRLPQLAGRELWALRIALEFEAGQDAFDRKLKEVLQ